MAIIKKTISNVDEYVRKIERSPSNFGGNINFYTAATMEINMEFPHKTINTSTI
jgi:hypothetical protein